MKPTQQPALFSASLCPNCEEPVYSGAAAQPHGCRLPLAPEDHLPDGVTGSQCACPRFDVLAEGDERRCASSK